MFRRHCRVYSQDDPRFSHKENDLFLHCCILCSTCTEQKSKIWLMYKAFGELPKKAWKSLQQGILQTKKLGTTGLNTCHFSIECQVFFFKKGVFCKIDNLELSPCYNIISRLTNIPKVVFQATRTCLSNFSVFLGDYLAAPDDALPLHGAPPVTWHNQEMLSSLWSLEKRIPPSQQVKTSIKASPHSGGSTAGFSPLSLQSLGKGEGGDSGGLCSV